MVRPWRSKGLGHGCGGGIGSAVAAIGGGGSEGRGLDRTRLKKWTARSFDRRPHLEGAFFGGVAEGRRAFLVASTFSSTMPASWGRRRSPMSHPANRSPFRRECPSRYLVTRETLEVMGAGGRIINVASELAYLGRQNASVYVASKERISGSHGLWRASSRRISWSTP